MRNLCLVFILLVTPALTFCQSLPPNPPNCGMYLTCYAVGGGVADNCTACESGYVLAKNSTSGCMSCFGCSPGCQSCQNAGPTKCDTCSQGYTLLPSQTCSPCIPNCTKCDVAGRGMCDPGLVSRDSIWLTVPAPAWVVPIPATAAQHARVRNTVLHVPLDWPSMLKRALVA